MSTAQPTAEPVAPRDQPDDVPGEGNRFDRARLAQAMARQFIEDYVAQKGVLPTGKLVGIHCNKTGRWGQIQLERFDDGPEGASSGTTASPQAGTVAALVAERNAEQSDSGTSTLVIGPAGTERPDGPSTAPRPEPRASAPVLPVEGPSSTGSTTTGLVAGATRVRAGTTRATTAGPTGRRSPTPWFFRKLVAIGPLLPLYVIAAGAFVAIWGGWVGLGRLTGFGPVELLPGIMPGWTIDSAITLPLGMEAYAAYALKVWLSPPPGLSERALAFARWSAIIALGLGALAQIAYHLMTAAGVEHAHWTITAVVACLPVGVLGMGAALAHLVRHPGGHS